MILLVSFRDEETESFRLRVKVGESVRGLRDAMERRTGISSKMLDLEMYNAKNKTFVALLDDNVLLTHHASILVSVRAACDSDSGSAPRSASLAIEGRLFGGASSGMVINEGGEGKAELGTGLVSWDAAVVLSSFLESHAEEFCTNKRIIELGAGTGTAGCKAASLNAALVVVTDLTYALENLSRNVNATLEALSLTSCRMEVRELDWLRPETWHREGDETGWDSILLADVVWLEELVQPLVNVLSALAMPHTVILLAHQLRTTRTDDLLWSALAQKGFMPQKVPQEYLPAQYRTDKINVFKMRKQFSS